jgi:hypothetical protein
MGSAKDGCCCCCWEEDADAAAAEDDVPASGRVIRTSDDSCFRVWVRFLLASARARVSSFGFFAGGGSFKAVSPPATGGERRPAVAGAAELLKGVVWEEWV